MKKRPRKGMFRDFKMRKEELLNNGYLKYVRLVTRDMVGNYDIIESQLNFMLFVYDYEFFTLDHMSSAYFYHKEKLGQRIVYPLMKKEYIYKYYDKLTPNSYEDAIFDESKMRYRVRYALTQKARLLVQKYYRKIEGKEQINVPS
jgi:hypothetical protein